MANTVYRLRSVRRLLDKEELQNQQIYFAHSTELNDPMEGVRDFYWAGDNIVWTNLFRNYVFCLHRTLSTVRLCNDNTPITADVIPVRAHLSPTVAPMEAWITENIWHDVCSGTALNTLISNLVATPRRVSRDELLIYLQLVYPATLTATHNVQMKYFGEPNVSELPLPPEPLRTFAELPTIFDKAVNDHRPKPEDPGRFFSAALQAVLDNWRFLADFRRNTDRTHGSLHRLTIAETLLDFPKVYLQALETLVYPPCCTASFMYDYRNSSSWGHYAEGHTGACLIFSTDATAEPSLTLKNTTDAVDHRDSDTAGPLSGETIREHKFTFYPMNYEENIPETDFFRSIGDLPLPILRENWYTDHDGTLSECGRHLEAQYEDAWRSDYWSEFIRGNSVKTKDWEYEKECRLILTNWVVDLREPKSRVFNYDFGALNGLIFGINTTESNKKKFVEVIREKCRRTSRRNFELYQAYYSREHKRIEKHQISVASDFWTTG